MNDLWMSFLSERCEQKIIDLAHEYPHQRTLTLSAHEMDRYDTGLLDALMESPDSAMSAGLSALLELVQDAETFDYEGTIAKDDLYIEIKDFRVSEKIRTIRSAHIDKMLALDGLVRSATDVRPKIAIAVYECLRCGTRISIPQPGIKTIVATRCPNHACDRGGPFKFLRKESKRIDSQHITLQEYPEDMKPGEQPHSVKLELVGELPGRVTPGERVTAVGIYRTIEDLKKSPFCETYMDGISLTSREANYDQIIITEKDEKAIRDLAKQPDVHEKIAKSIAPAIFGMEDVKEALALQLVGTAPKTLIGGTRRRGDIHVLLVGDPGLAKSQLLRYAKSISPRGVFTSGKSATSAGLTYAAVKDQESGRWTLEAGALPMADGGIACIDELDKMREEDRSALHEAMEQQVINVSKAGILATLKCGCSVLAAANPKLSRFDEWAPIAAQINLQPALLSRFDLIFVIQDKVDKVKDALVADSILGISQPSDQPILDPDFLRKYFAFCRRQTAMVFDDGADEVLKNAYLSIRLSSESSKDAKPIPITPRYLEGMVRLAEASARLRLSGIVSKDDATRAARVMIDCLKKVGIDPETGEFDVGAIDMGMTKRFHDKTRAVLQLLERMSKDFVNGVPLEDLQEIAEKELGIDKHHLESMIDRLKTDGEIYARRYNEYLLT